MGRTTSARNASGRGARRLREPKPHVVGFVASVVLLAAVSTAVEEAAEQRDDVTIDVVAQGPQGETSSPAATPSPSATDGAGTAVTGTDGAGGEEPAPAPSQGQDADAGTGGATPQGPSATASPTPAAPGESTLPSDQPSATEAPAQPAPSSQPTTAPAQPSWPDADLYSGDENTRGITADRLTICGHAALALGAAFDTSREDLNVYWDVVNQSGGLHGRTVDMTWEDDAYVSDQAVRAATTCADKNPFMILGGIGFDQIPGVRNWAEANGELYMHHIAVAPEQDYQHVFSLSPTVQHVGEESGNHIVARHADRKVGVIYRDTDNWAPGADAGIAVMEAAGVDVQSHAVFQNQGVYAQQLNAMRTSGVEVVWVWENALNAAQIINQATEQGWKPTWVVFPFQTTLDILNDTDDLTMEGVASWNSYAPGGYGDQWADKGLADEIAAFEAAYAEHRPDTIPNDLLWQVWMGNKVLHQMFSDCGADCTRNRFAGMMLDGYRTTVRAGCEVDFGGPRSFGGHHGNHRFFTQEVFYPASGPAFRTTTWCAKTLG